MEILVESCLDDLFIALINKDKIIDKIHIKKLVKKSDALSDYFNNILTRNKLAVGDLKTIYVTKGPGSFMGVRAGVIFCATLASIANINLKTISTLNFIAKNGEAVIDARGGQFYKLSNGQISLVENDLPTNVSYSSIEKNISKIIRNFESIDPLLLKPMYIKEPRIG